MIHAPVSLQKMFYVRKWADIIYTYSVRIHVNSGMMELRLFMNMGEIRRGGIWGRQKGRSSL